MAAVKSFIINTGCWGSHRVFNQGLPEVVLKGGLQPGLAGHTVQQSRNQIWRRTADVGRRNRAVRRVREAPVANRRAGFQPAPQGAGYQPAVTGETACPTSEIKML